MNKNIQSSKGFTLVEIMIVVVIIGLLAAIIVIGLIVMAVRSHIFSRISALEAKTATAVREEVVTLTDTTVQGVWTRDLALLAAADKRAADAAAEAANIRAQVISTYKALTPPAPTAS